MPKPKLSFILVLALPALFIISGCAFFSEPAKERDFGALGLFLPLTAFPEGWETVGEFRPMGAYSPIGVGETSDAYVSYKQEVKPRNGASYFVYWDPSIGWAKVKFNHRHDLANAYNSIYVTPDELSYRSAYADNFYLKCRIPETIEEARICILVAQYEEFVVELYGRIAEDALSLEELNIIVCNVDALFVARLELSQVPINCDSNTLSGSLRPIGN